MYSRSVLNITFPDDLVRISFSRPPKATSMGRLIADLGAADGVRRVTEDDGCIIVERANCFFTQQQTAITIYDVVGIPPSLPSSPLPVSVTMRMVIYREGSGWWRIETDRRHDAKLLIELDGRCGVPAGTAQLTDGGYSLRVKITPACWGRELLARGLREVIDEFYAIH